LKLYKYTEQIEKLTFLNGVTNYS